MDRDAERAPGPEFLSANPGDGPPRPLAWGAADAQRITQPLPIPAGPIAAGPIAPGAGGDPGTPWPAAVLDPFAGTGAAGAAGAARAAAGPAAGGDRPPPVTRGDRPPPVTRGDRRPPVTRGDRAGRGARHVTIAAGAAVILLLLAAPTVLLTAWVNRAHPGSTGSRGVSVSAGAVRTVYLQAPPGLLVVTGAPGGQARLAGQLHWSGRAPAARVTAGPAGVLRLWYRCAAASPCTGNLRLTVPGQARLVLGLPSGRMVLSGLTGPVSITAANVSVRASGLRSPSFTAVITSGQLAAAFAGPPRRLQVTLASAQATVRLPGSVGYAVSTRVSSGSVTVGVPRSAASAYRVSIRVDRAQLQLLPA